MSELEVILKNHMPDLFLQEDGMLYDYRVKCLNALKEAHNLGLEKAAEAAEVKEEFEFQDEFSNENVYSHTIDKDSILKLKIK